MSTDRNNCEEQTHSSSAEAAAAQAAEIKVGSDGNLSGDVTANGQSYDATASDG